MTDYSRLVKEWHIVVETWRLRVSTKQEVSLADTARSNGIDSKKKTNDKVGGGGHKDYLRLIPKNTACLNAGTTDEQRLAHAERQLALYTDKKDVQHRTGAASVRTEVVKAVVGGAEAKAGEPQEREAKEARAAGQTKTLLLALGAITGDEAMTLEQCRELARVALARYETLGEARKAKAAARKAKADAPPAAEAPAAPLELEDAPADEEDSASDSSSESSSESSSDSEEEEDETCKGHGCENAWTDEKRHLCPECLAAAPKPTWREALALKKAEAEKAKAAAHEAKVAAHLGKGATEELDE